MNILTIILIIVAVLGAGAAIWFFVLHKKLSTIHQAIDAVHQKIAGGQPLPPAVAPKK